MVKRYRVLIGGEWLGDDLPGIDVVNPYDDSVIGVVPEAGDREVERAIIAARQGFAELSGMPAYRRSEILARTADFILRDREEIAAIIAREAGKSWKYAL
ncbi:MAG: aldehyde dehydrogenase family protein, partial [Geobacteraceae bacterium]|nr:aldehyde dehydrogenase family protein [Geobacteraceae bacterium]